MLQKCPYGCSSYIRRKDIVAHKTECRQTRKQSIAANEPIAIPDNNPTQESQPHIEQDVAALRTALHEEIRQRHRLIADIGELRRQNQQLDIWLECVEAAQKDVQDALGEEAKTRTDDISALEKRIDDLAYQYKVFKSGFLMFLCVFL